MRREASPSDGAGETKLIEDFRVVVRDAAGENLAFPGVGRSLIALELAQSFERATLAEKLCGRSDMLPAKQPARELRRADRLNFVAQFAEGEAVNSREEAPIAPFGLRGGWVGEFSAKHGAAGFEPQERLINFVGRNAERVAELV